MWLTVRPGSEGSQGGRLIGAQRQAAALADERPSPVNQQGGQPQKTGLSPRPFPAPMMPGKPSAEAQGGNADSAAAAGAKRGEQARRPSSADSSESSRAERAEQEEHTLRKRRLLRISLGVSMREHASGGVPESMRKSLPFGNEYGRCAPGAGKDAAKQCRSAKPEALGSRRRSAKARRASRAITAAPESGKSSALRQPAAAS